MRSYLRVSPQAVEDKQEDGYSLAQIGAYVALLCAAEQQPERGRFKNRKRLVACLDSAARYVDFLLERGDLEIQPDGTYYVVHWDEWQEGNWQVAERMRRVREARDRRRAVTPAVTPPVTVDVTVETEPPVTPPVTDRARVEAVGGKRLAESPAHARGNGASEIPSETAELLQLCHEFMGRQLSGKEAQAVERLPAEAPRMTNAEILRCMEDRREWLASNDRQPYKHIDEYLVAVRERDHWLADQGVTRPRGAAAGGWGQVGAVLGASS